MKWERCVSFAFTPTAFSALKKYGPCVQVCVAGHLQVSFSTWTLPEKSKGKWRTEEFQSQGGGAPGRPLYLTLAYFPEKKKSFCVYIIITCSFLPGKEVGHCVPACVVIDNNLVLMYALRGFCNQLRDLRTEDSTYISSYSYSVTLDPEVNVVQ